MTYLISLTKVTISSFHYDVRKDVTPFEKLDFEKDYPYYASGGFIHYCEYPKLNHNLKALEAVWDYSYDKVGYLGTNIPIDHCYKCDYDGILKRLKMVINVHIVAIATLKLSMWLNEHVAI